MAAVLLFWDTNMAAVTSCENTLLLLETLERKKTNRRYLRHEAAWPSGQPVGLTIRRSRVRVPLWPLAGFVSNRPEFKSLATLVISQLVALCQLGFFNPVMLYLNYLFLSI